MESRGILVDDNGRQADKGLLLPFSFSSQVVASLPISRFVAADKISKTENEQELQEGAMVGGPTRGRRGEGHVFRLSKPRNFYPFFPFFPFLPA